MEQAAPPTWTEEELESDRRRSIDIFRHERITEPLEKYLSFYEEKRKAISEILQISDNLLNVREKAAAILGDPGLMHTARYLSSPPISEDDLATIAELSFAPTLNAKDPGRAAALMDVILLGLDRERFPWVAEGRPPEDEEKRAAIVSTAALHARQAAETSRRHTGKNTQEQMVKDFLVNFCNFKEVRAKTIRNHTDFPRKGTFTGEAEVCGRKADICVCLWDGRLMPIECKVSNSNTNSYKRINNDAAVKAVAWRDELGEANVVPAAVLAGCFALKNLTYAQRRRLSLFWAHELEPLRDFIETTRSSDK